MKSLNKVFSLLLVLTLLFSLCIPMAMGASGLNTVRIYSADDLVALSRQCSLDSWSQGKTIFLMRDVDLSQSEFTPIPTFGGTFDGQGHTISGLNLRDSGDVRGLFRYIQATGVVQDLTVDGLVHPAESKDILGGIAGNNSGTISNCVFLGTISGENTVGGIAGINQAVGQIINCSFSGTITGEHYVGGIAGQNYGSIVCCENRGSVNTTEVKPTPELSDLNLEQLNSMESSPAITDIGGIAGFSAGILQSCRNMGNVGYPHVGYNVGGIAGRQTGYLDSCVNEGLVQGRKDVGGIAGQMEPQLILQYDQDALDQIWRELDALEYLINDFLNDTSGLTNRVSNQIQAVSDSAANVKNAVSDLSSAFTDWTDGSINQINDASARISWVMERMVPVVDTIELAMGQVELAFGRLSDGLDEASLAAKYGSETAKSMTQAMNSMQNAIASARLSLTRLQSALEQMTQGLGDSDITQQALDNMADALSDFAAAFGGITDGLDQLYEAMDDVYEWVQTEPAWTDLRNGVGDLRDAFGDVFDALNDISDTLELIAGDSDLSHGMELLSTSAGHLLDCFGHLGPALRDLLTAYDAFRDGNTSDARDSLEQAVDRLDEALEDFDLSVSDLVDALDAIEGSDTVTEYLPQLEEQLIPLSAALTAVRDAVDEINGALDELEQSDVPGETVAAVRSALDTIMGHLDEAGDAVESFTDALVSLADNIDPQALERAWKELQSSLSVLNAAAYSLTLSVGHLNTALDTLSEAADALAQSMTSLSGAGTSLANAFDSLEKAVGDVGDILDELAAMPAIQFENLNGSITDEGEALDTAATEFIDSFNTLNTTLRTESDVLVGDLKGINGQIGNIIDLLQQLYEEQLNANAEDLLEDISSQDTDDSRSNGKISASRNLGAVEGDTNVAGIVGSLGIEYDFDPEDDLTADGNRTLSFRFLARAVVRGCENHGTVTAKKNYAGGISGNMQLGRVAQCQSYGTVTSTSGSYVGGIAGASSGGIQDSWAMCTLSGSKYVGGVAGLGSLIIGCRTLVDLSSSAIYQGAIAGQVEENAELTDNYFVHHSLAGVDGISYAGAAQPMEYSSFRTLENLPAPFTEFKLVFTADGTVVATIPFQYGDSLSQLPDIPEKVGHSAQWPELDLSFLCFNRTLEAQYTLYDTALSDGLSLPQMLVAGSFSPAVQTTVTEAGVSWIDAEGNSHQGTAYTVTVTDEATEQITYTLHWRLPEEGEYDLWVLNGPEWVMRDYTPDGSYLLLDCVGESITFVLTEQKAPPFLLYGLLLLAVIMIVIVVLLLIRRTKRKKKQLVTFITGE